METFNIPLLIVVRHGECDHHKIRDRLFGQYDVPLTPEGYFQMLVVGEEIFKILDKIDKQFYNISSFLSSDLHRCEKSAEALKVIFQQKINRFITFHALEDLREYHIGDWELAYDFEKRDEVEKFIKEYKHSPFLAKPPGIHSESHYNVSQRLLPLIKRINRAFVRFQSIKRMGLECSTIDDLVLRTKEERLLHIDIHIWVLHEGPARMVFQLLNVDTDFRSQDIGGEFLLNIHQTFLERGDFVCLIPIYNYGIIHEKNKINHFSNEIKGTTKPDFFNTCLNCKIGWRVLHHHMAKRKT